MKTTWLAAAAVILTATMARAEEPSGSFKLERNGALVGTVRIETVGGKLVLATHLDDGAERPLARHSGPRTFTYDGQLPSLGLAGVLNGNQVPPADAVWTVELRGALLQSGVWRARVKANGATQFEERLVKMTGKRALMIPQKAWDPTHVNAFKAYATHVKRRYDAMGYDRTDILFGESWAVVFDALKLAETEHRPYTRVIFIGHGGWDGPIGLGPQVSSESDPENFKVFLDAVRRGTTPDAKIFASTCHSGGSDKYEEANAWNNKYRWVDDVALQTGRTVAGPRGKTSTEYTEQHVFAVLEGEGVTRQAIRWASPEGVRNISAKGTLAAAPLLPVEPIYTRPAPAPITPPVIVTDPVTPPVVTEPVVTEPVVTEPVVNLPLGTP
jgi:hypothetical protein